MNYRSTSRCALALVMLLSTGCGTYNPRFRGYYSYAQTRKVVNSPTYPIFKVFFSPLIFIPETLISPVTAYMDSSSHPPESADGHVYLSYVGFRTINNAQKTEASSATLYVAQLLVTIVDTVWFPIAGLVDSAYIMTRDNPEREFGGSPPKRVQPPPPEPSPPPAPIGVFDGSSFDRPVGR